MIYMCYTSQWQPRLSQAGDLPSLSIKQKDLHHGGIAY